MSGYACNVDADGKAATEQADQAVLDSGVVTAQLNAGSMQLKTRNTHATPGIAGQLIRTEPEALFGSDPLGILP